MIGEAVQTRSGEWKAMITRAIDRGELPAGTDSQLLLDFVRALADDSARRSPRLDTARLTLAVKTVLAGARTGVLVRK